MEIRQLRHFLALVEEGSFTQAAREALRGFDSVHEAVGQVSQRLTGRLSIGVFTHVEHIVAPAAVELDITRLAAEPFVPAGSRRHPLRQARSIALRDLGDHSMVTSARLIVRPDKPAPRSRSPPAGRPAARTAPAP